jgi:hypothetical protein
MASPTIYSNTITLCCTLETKQCKSKEQLYTFIRLHKKKCEKCRIWNYAEHHHSGIYHCKTEEPKQIAIKHFNKVQDELQGLVAKP